jgi:hypothetical protein
MKTSSPDQNAHSLNKLVWIVRDHLAHRQKRSAEDFHIALWRFYEAHGNELLAAFARINTLKFIFGPEAIGRVKAEMIGKKSALYAGCALCVIPSIFFVGKSQFAQSDYFCNFVMKNRKLISMGRLIPFPVIDAAPKYGGYARAWLKTQQMLAIEKKLNEERLGSYACMSNAVPIFGEHQGLVQQLNEDIGSAAYKPVGIQEIALPSLGGISMDTLLDVIDDNGDPTARFRGMLRALLKDPNALSSERDLFYKILEIGDEVRNLDSQFKSIAKSRALTGTGVIVGSIATSLSLLAPSFMTEGIAKAIGTSSITDGFKSLKEIASARDDAMKSSFVLPWILHHQSTT